MIDKGKPRGSKGQRTRQKLLSAAEREFGEKGFHAASISSITARARVAQGTFYFHFRGKEEIFGTLVREIGTSLRKRMGEAVTTQRSRMAAERVGLRAFLRFAAEHQGLYRIVQESQFVDEAVYREYYERVAPGLARGAAWRRRQSGARSAPATPRCAPGPSWASAISWACASACGATKNLRSR